MDKKRVILSVIVLLLGASSIITLILFAPCRSITMEPEGCDYLFGVSPQEFMQTQFEFYSETGDFRKNARVTEEGDLILSLSLFQMYTWKNSAWLSDFSEYPEKEPFDISPDYKKLDVYLAASTSLDEYEKIKRECSRIFARMDMLQILSGIHSDNVHIEYTVIDKDTGEILLKHYY